MMEFNRMFHKVPGARVLALALVVAICVAGRVYPQQSLNLPASQGQSSIIVRARSATTSPVPDNTQVIPAAPPPAQKSERPPPLEPQAGCELWHGTFSGNDPSVLVEARLCTDEQAGITGDVQWSSLVSGYNV